jgi:hypothetical protein
MAICIHQKKTQILHFSPFHIQHFLWFFCRNTQIINFIKTRRDFGMHESNRDFGGSFLWSFGGKTHAEIPPENP